MALGTPILLNGPVGLFKAISVVTVTGPIRDSNGTGPAPPKTNLGLTPGILIPPTARPPKLSLVKGCVKLPPPVNANFCDKMFGNEFSWPALNNAPSVIPAVFEFPKET